MRYEKDGVTLEAANDIQSSAFINSGFTPVEEEPKEEAAEAEAEEPKPKARRGRKPKAESEAAEA